MTSYKFTYGEIREQICNGDIILWKGTSLISRIIMWFTEFSHASLVVRLDIGNLKDRIFIVEALPEGLSLRLLSNKIKNYSGNVFIYKLSNYTMGPCRSFQRTRLRDNAIMDMAKGISYDYKGLFENVFGRVHRDAKQFFCSEFVEYELEKVAATLKPGADNTGAARPGDLPLRYDGILYEIKKD